MPEKSGKRVGKLPAGTLENLIRITRSSPSPSTLIGPGIGEDASIVDTSGCLLVSHVDPITEAGEYAGYLAVTVAANDIAVTGAIPRWAQLLLLLPPDAGPEEAEKILKGASRAAEKLGIDIVGGHTENSPGVAKPVIAAFVMGCACKECLTPTRAAKPGHHVIQVGWAGAEGTAILASDFSELLAERGVPGEIIEEAQGIISDVSILEPALEIARRRLASAMHDATEGGILGALVELARASKATVEVDASKILVHPVTARIASALGIDPLRLISSGSFIIASDPDYAEEIIDTAGRLGRPARVIGRIVSGPPLARVIYQDGRILEYIEPPEDEISRFWV